MLRDQCRTSNGDKILASYYNYGQVTYSGTVYLVALGKKPLPNIVKNGVLNTDSENDDDDFECKENDRKYILLYKVPCSFTAHVDKEGCTTVQDHPEHQKIKFQTTWLGNRCEPKTNTFYSIIQTCVSRHLVFAQHPGQQHQVLLINPEIRNATSNPKFKIILGSDSNRCISNHNSGNHQISDKLQLFGQNTNVGSENEHVNNDDYCCQNWYLASQETSKPFPPKSGHNSDDDDEFGGSYNNYDNSLIGVKELQWNLVIDGHLQYAKVKSRISFDVVNPCKKEKFNLGLPAKAHSHKVGVYSSLFKNKEFSETCDASQGFRDNERVYALIHVDLPLSLGLNCCYDYEVVITHIQVCTLQCSDENGRRRRFERFDVNRPDSTGCNTQFDFKEGENLTTSVLQYTVYDRENKEFGMTL